MRSAELPPLLLSRGSALRLLLIEDSASDADLITALLEDELASAELDCATSLQQAMLHLETASYDVILADLSLPDAEGLAVVRAVHDAYPATTLVVLTGRADGDLALQSLAEGAQDYLVKGREDGARIATALLHAVQRQRAEQEAQRYLQLARGLLDALEAPTCAVGADSSLVAVNAAWHGYMADNGGLSLECSEGSNYLATCDRVATDSPDAFDARAVADGLRAVLSGRAPRFQHEYRCVSPDATRWLSVRVSPAEVDGGAGAVVSHIDVSAMHQVQDLLSHQALHDALTGLPNRLLLADRLEQALADGERRGTTVAAAFVDLDHFKRVNDSLGHQAGDDLLAMVAHRLSASFRGSETVSRFSGDEFVVLWRDVAHPQSVHELSTRLLALFREPFQLADTAVTVSASVGVAVSDSLATSESLLQAADAAMYEAKRLGRGRYRAFSDDLRRGAANRMAVEVGLRAAIENHELVLHYQPVINLADGQPVGVEALVRWQHPTQGLLPPGHFIPVAESSGLIEPLGVWVLRQACRDAAAFRGPDAALDMAVNLSVRQLTQPDLLAHVVEALSSSGLAPERLLLEVTESAVMEDEQAAAMALRALADIGVRMAIDDFGTGYSSLLYLRRYPISALKIDRAFVAGIGTSSDDEAICSSVVSLAHAVGATSIAEGVETERQYAALRAFGCQQAQGFLWSPGVSVETLPEVLAGVRQVPVAAPGRRRLRVGDRLEPMVAARIDGLHKAGASLHTIAAAMNREAAPNPLGGRWTANAIAHHLSRPD